MREIYGSHRGYRGVWLSIERKCVECGCIDIITPKEHKENLSCPNCLSNEFDYYGRVKHTDIYGKRTYDDKY